MNLSDIFEKYTPEYYSDVSTVSQALVKMMENNKSIVSFTYHREFNKDLIPDDDFVCVSKDKWEYRYKIPKKLMDAVCDIHSKEYICISFDDHKKMIDDVIPFLCNNVDNIYIVFTFLKDIPSIFELDFNVYIIDNHIRNIMCDTTISTKTLDYKQGNVVL